MSNIGEFNKNANGFYIGKIDTLAVSLTLALREVHSPNPNAPTYEIHARSAAGSWVQVGALWDQHASETGEVFLQGSIDDPSLDKRLYIACFRREDESYAIAWSRPRRNRAELPAAVNAGNTDEPGMDFDGGSTAPANKGRSRKASADLGESTSDAQTD
jgi:uncharacterized protein (DUF736 family)